MKLTKGKISKLYNKKHQSHRRNKKMPKNKRSFRKRRPLNLASKTLKMMHGGRDRGKRMIGFVKKIFRPKKQTETIDKIEYNNGLISKEEYEAEMDKIGEPGVNESFKDLSVFFKQIHEMERNNRGSEMRNKSVAQYEEQQNALNIALKESLQKYASEEQIQHTIELVNQEIKDNEQYIEDSTVLNEDLLKEMVEVNKLLTRKIEN